LVKKNKLKISYKKIRIKRKFILKRNKKRFYKYKYKNIYIYKKNLN